MPKNKKKTTTPYTTEAREDYLISLAMDQAEKQLLEGTAPASTVNYFLKLASEESRIKKRMIEAQTELAEAKKRNMELSERELEVYESALEAFKSYSGGGLC